MAGKKILFLICEDWFAKSHYMPLLERAHNDGYDVAVACRRSGVDLGDVRQIDFPFLRGSVNPWQILREVRFLREVIAVEKPDIIHAVSLRPIALLLVAGHAGFGSVFAVTGRGFLTLGGCAAEEVATRAAPIQIPSRRIHTSERLPSC